MSIKENIDIIRKNIDAALVSSSRDKNSVEVIAVSKRVHVESIRIAHNCGIQSFGENYVQELREKVNQIDDVSWHFIGQLQSNKVKYIIREIYMLHSLDRLSLTKELDKHLRQLDKKLKVLVQVNISHEPQKGGVLPSDVERFLNELMQFDTLDVCGLMCMPAVDNTTLETVRDFAATKDIYDTMKSAGFNMRYLSMGMSNDYIDAIKQGANLVRVGSAIFGMRT